MNSFLGEVASHLYAKHGAGISKLNIIFPSRRARLFFVDALTRITTRPIWQPKWGSIDEIMSQAAKIETGERVRLISELYKIYSTFHNETFDKFYFWGEILLSDFDMVDKYLLDADMLFRNISEIKELESDISYLTPEQLKIISFWSSLGKEADLSEEKRKFLKIWNSLCPIYHLFRARLCELGIAYSGMIYRHAVERIANEEHSFDGSTKYIFVGFNALSECEKRVFLELKKRGMAEFYWDYDNYYSQRKEQEAGLFIRENLNIFSQAAEISHDNMNTNKNIEVVSTASNILQCKYVSNILEQIKASGEVVDKNTAIILTDENLLLPLLYSLPQQTEGVNVTMGYPLRETLAYTFTERLIELQRTSRSRGGTKVEFYHADVVGLLCHPYVMAQQTGIAKEITDNRMIYIDSEYLSHSELLGLIFSPQEDWGQLSKYLTDCISAVLRQEYEGEDADHRDEFLNAIHTHITTLRNSIEMCQIDISIPIYTSLLRRHLQTLRLPFEGEPLEGLQVMGILESRNLDFRNVIILSMCDDNFPGNHLSHPSYIPYSLRSAYGLPTPEHHEGVYAYYFYRLMQRAQRVWLLYSSHSDEKSTGEPSRYIHQLNYESPFDIKRLSVGVDVNLIESENIEVKKVGRTAEKLAYFTRTENPIPLSPTAIYRYIACPMRFYFYSIAGIRRDEELSEGVDAPMFGTILHAAMQELYTPLIGVANFEKRLLEATKEIEAIVERAISNHYLKCDGGKKAEYSGNILLIKDIVCRYIKDGVVKYDISHSDFIVEGVEQSVEYDFPLENSMRVKLRGIADRIDRLRSGKVRVVDYKTGGAHLEFKGIESLFEGDGKDRLSNIIQTLLYSMILTKGQREAEVCPALYYVRSIASKEYSPHIIDREGGESREVLSYNSYSEEFERHIKATLNELFDMETPFRQCTDQKNTCPYCDYRTICKR